MEAPNNAHRAERPERVRSTVEELRRMQATLTEQQAEITAIRHEQQAQITAIEHKEQEYEKRMQAMEAGRLHV